MGFFTKQSSNLLRGRETTRPLIGPSRFRQLAGVARARLRPAIPALKRDELLFARRWGAAQKKEWGWHLEVRYGTDGEPRILAFAGAQGTSVDWVIYRVEAGFQSDEWTGESRWSPTLEDALSEIAPMAKADAVATC